MERELKTIQKRGKLNSICAIDEKGIGNANHLYKIKKYSSPVDDKYIARIEFQNGPRSKENSTTGVLDVDLLEIVRDRLIGFQSGEYATRENAMALTKIEEALLWLNKRTEDRLERNVLGTEEK